ncbi:tripartite tricarboxylate transporter permease, partial [Hansschlegelia zhihuaiae]
LGDRAEDAFRQALLGSGGSLSVFWANGLVTTLVVLSAILLFWGPISDALAWARGRGKDREPARTVEVIE